MGLGAKRTAGKPLIGALGHETDEDFLGLLQISQEQALKLAAAVGIIWEILELLQRQGQMTFADLLPERLRPAEKPVRQMLDLSSTEFFAAQRGDELVDGRAAV